MQYFNLDLWLGLLFCVGPLLLLGVLPVFVVFTLAGEDYRGIRRLFRERRFGLLSIFLMTAIVAVTFGVLRATNTDFADPSIVCFGTFSLGVGIVVVGLIWLMFSERLERSESRKMLSKARTPDVQISVPPTADEIPLAELVEDETEESEAT